MGFLVRRVDSMRILFFISLCICSYGHAKDIQSCAEIKSAVERLDCYDQLAKDRDDTPAATTAPATSKTLKSEPPAVIPLPHAQEPISDVAQSQSDETKVAEPENKSSRWSLFGLKPKKDKSQEITHISATLDKVEYMSNGKKVFTLSNGQVWIERESTPRKIATGQTVTIIKKRWHFELDPEWGPRVTVERQDPDKNIVRTKDRREM